MKFYLSTIDPQAHLTARKYGLGLEVAEYCTAWNLDEKFRETDAVVREKLQNIPERILHGPFNELFPCAIDPMVKDTARYRYRQAIRLSQEYGIRKIVLHGGYNPWLYYPVWYTGQSIAFWKAFIREVPEDFQIVLENVLEETPEMLLAIIREVNDPRLRMCLDVGHVHAYSKLPVQQWLKVCAPYISHFHVHNNDGTGDSHSPLFEGSIPMKALLQEMEARCPEATVTLELMEGEPSVKCLEL